MRFLTHLIIGLVLFSILAGCGMGGSTINDSPSSVTIQGTVAKGLFTSGTVRAYRVENGEKGSVLASTRISNNGSYSLSIPSTAPVLLEAWGSYRDEATDTILSIDQSTPLRSVVWTPSSGPVAITPLTELACRLMATYSREEVQRATTLVEEIFKIGDIIGTQPLPYDPTGSSYAGNPSDRVEYTTILAIISKLDADDSSRDMGGIIDMIRGGISGGTMTDTLSTTIQNALGSIMPDTSPWPDLALIGARRVTITMGIGESATPHTGLQITLKLPDAAYVPTLPSTLSVRAVSPSYYEPHTPISVPGDASPVVLDTTHKTLTVILAMNGTLTVGDVISLSFDLPGGTPLPEALSYNGLVVTYGDALRDTTATVSARIKGGGIIDLREDQTIPTPSRE